ncbi:MAG: PKD domain-containing protein [Bacteroidales bacterium]|nr:PKD domain-containing protein [Bacteroidales bacterium]
MTRFIFIFLLFLNFILQISGQTPDPGLTGPYTVTSEKYDFGDETFTTSSFPVGIEVRGKVFYPTTLSPGPFPFILLLHGRHESCYSGSSSSLDWPCSGGYSEIPSYEGYDYLAQKLASNGYIVVSIGANSISASDNATSDRGMAARAELIQYHLDLWKTFNTTGGTPFGTKFVGKIDLTKVGTMGHSRGGEGVINHAIYNRNHGSPYGVKAVLTIAPTDFWRPVLSGIPVAVVLPYCDGDVTSLHGIHFFDDARYIDVNDSTPKYYMTMMGANHNYFNTTWTDGLFPAAADDEWTWVDLSSSDPHCGTSAPGNKRFASSKQRAALIAYASAFFRVYVGGETQFLPILNVDDQTPPASSTLSASDIHLAYHPAGLNRVDVNRIDKKSTETINTLNDVVSSNGLLTYIICGESTGNQFCVGTVQSQEPHNAYYSTQRVGLTQLKIRWNSADDWYENKIPAKYRNLTQFRALQFRAAINFKDGPSGQSVDFVVQLHTTSGDTQTVRVSSNSNALYFPPGTLSSYLPHLIENTIKIPLSKFNNINLSSVDAIRFMFNKSTAGAILISDVMFSSDSAVVLSPVANFNANTTSTCDGEVIFSDNSLDRPTQWLWNFGDGNISVNQNPLHTYTSNGTYTVKLKVTNPAGKDSLTKTSYIVVNRPAAPTGTGDTRCGAGIVNLSATGSGGGSIVWYDAPIGGNKLYTGTNYSPNISDTTIFYVQEEIPGSIITGGKAAKSTGGNLNVEHGLYFNVFKPCTLKSVQVYATNTANRTIELRDSNNTVLQTKTVSITNNPNVLAKVTLDFVLTPGIKYILKAINTPNLYRDNSGVSFPYNISDLISITTSTAGTNPQNYYYFFYNWEVQGAPCKSARTAVTGIVDTCTNVANNLTISKPAIYPNPAGNILMIEKDNDKNKILFVEIVNVLGEKIYSANIENNSGKFKKSLNIKDVPTGVYFVYIKTKDNNWVYKLVKK